jgi:transposase
VIAPGGESLRIYLATRPVDFRKGHDGLSAIVQETFGCSPFSGALFVFRSRRADRIKVLFFDQTGLVLAHKRLEDANFVWPGVRDGVIQLSPAQFAALFEGLDWRLVRPHRPQRPALAG